MEIQMNKRTADYIADQLADQIDYFSNSILSD